MLRKLVPALGVLTLCAAAPAQEIAKGLFMDGWVDTLFTVVDTPYPVPANNPEYSQRDASTDFLAKASLKVGYKVADRVSAKINMWYNTNGADETPFTVREMFINVDLGNHVTWTTGKFINHLGWISAEPTGLFRVNASTIGYNGTFYGANDPIGTGLGWMNSQANYDLGATVYVTNGYFNEKDGSNADSVDNGTQKKNAVGLGLDLVANVGPDKETNLNLDFAIDPNLNPAYTYVLGLNATTKLRGKDDPIKLGAEVIAKVTQNGGGSASGDSVNTLGMLGMVNYQLPENSKQIPMSVTAMYQRIDNDFDGSNGGPAARENRDNINEISLALLTNPFRVSNFGLNAEVAYAFVDGNPNSANDNVTTVALEAIAVIP